MAKCFRRYSASLSRDAAHLSRVAPHIPRDAEHPSREAISPPIDVSHVSLDDADRGKCEVALVFAPKPAKHGASPLPRGTSGEGLPASAQRLHIFQRIRSNPSDLLLLSREVLRICRGVLRISTERSRTSLPGRPRTTTRKFASSSRGRGPFARWRVHLAGRCPPLRKCCASPAMGCASVRVFWRARWKHRALPHVPATLRRNVTHPSRAILPNPGGECRAPPETWGITSAMLVLIGGGPLNLPLDASHFPASCCVTRGTLRISEEMLLNSREMARNSQWMTEIPRGVAGLSQDYASHSREAHLPPGVACSSRTTRHLLGEAGRPFDEPAPVVGVSASRAKASTPPLERMRQIAAGAGRPPPFGPFPRYSCEEASDLPP
jgi:hypothetical protein